jgi:hypothetical protein
MSTTLQDPSARLLDLSPPSFGVPPEPVALPPPMAHDTSTMLERLDHLRSAAVSSRNAAKTLGSAGTGG